MDKQIIKQDEFTIKISGSNPYEQTVTKDQLIARLAELESNKQGIMIKVTEIEGWIAEVQGLLDIANEQGCLTRDEFQAIEKEKEDKKEKEAKENLVEEPIEEPTVVTEDPIVE